MSPEEYLYDVASNELPHVTSISESDVREVWTEKVGTPGIEGRIGGIYKYIGISWVVLPVNPLHVKI